MKSSFELRPEQWVIFGAFIFLAIVGTVKALMLPDIESVLPGGKQTKPNAYEVNPLADLEQRWNAPPAISIADHKVYVSRLIVYRPEIQKIEFLSEDKLIKDIPVKWLEQYSFSLEDPNIADLDPDQDGFSNLEEYKSATDPKNVADHPDFVQKLCLKEYEFIAFNLEFKGYSPNVKGDGYVYQINLLDVARGRTRMVQEDDVLEGYKVGKFTKKKVIVHNKTTGIDEEVDVSELVIINPTLNKPITLVLNVPTKSDESKVVFHLKVPNVSPEPASVNIGETFKVQDKTYQLLEATEARALIKEILGGTEYPIQPCK